MRSKSKKVVTTLAITAALVLVPAAAAMATTVAVGGGLWNYGVSWPYAYSNYHHPSKYHSATACAYWDNCVQSAAAAGSWANASIFQSCCNNTAYWNTY